MTLTTTDYCINTLGGQYSIVREYSPRFDTLRCKVECEYILDEGCPFRGYFPFFEPIDPEFGVDPPCIESIFSFARGETNCGVLRD